ncbi:hypothetical protein [Edwardsiella tarda]
MTPCLSARLVQEGKQLAA